MKPCKIGPFEAEYDETLLVKTPTKEYPQGYGVHVQFETARVLREVVLNHRKLVCFLAHEVGVLKLTAAEGQFHIGGARKRERLDRRPDRSTALHVDLSDSTPESARIKFAFATAFCPEYWEAGTHLFWQNTGPVGRCASTVCVPPSVTAPVIVDLATTPEDALIEEGFIQEEERKLWGWWTKSLRRSLNYVEPDPISCAMAINDLNNFVFQRTTGVARDRILSLSDRATERILDQVEPYTVEMKWTSPEALKGAVCVSDMGRKGEEKKLLHARRNRGKYMGKATVWGEKVVES